MYILYSLLLALAPAMGVAQSTLSCGGPSPSSGIRPSIASGYQYQVVATGLSRPRGLILDNAGNLLVVQAGTGRVTSFTVTNRNGCISLSDSTDVTSQLNLNHGIEMSADGRTLYASSAETLYAWDYNGTSRQVSGQRTLINGMTTTDHSTRTLLLSRKVPGMMVIGRGSQSNLDYATTSLSSGISQVKAFNLNNNTGGTYNYTTSGLLLGWGLRNEVGIAEHPNTGGIWGVENSADNIQRDGVDIHATNPGEELNFLGYLNGTAYARQGTNFGYPWCFSAWNVGALPNNQNLTVGSQFAISSSSDLNNQNRTDAYCAAQSPPRLVFAAHMAPLDMKFNNSALDAWITFHGSWNSPSPVGYKLSVVRFGQGGDPVDPSDSTTAATDIFSNQDNTRCPNNCFRPVAMAIDQQGRIFMTSDASGEIYVISRAGGATGATSTTSTSGGSATGTATAGTASSTASKTGTATKMLSPWGIGVVAALLALFV